AERPRHNQPAEEREGDELHQRQPGVTQRVLRRRDDQRTKRGPFLTELEGMRDGQEGPVLGGRDELERDGPSGLQRSPVDGRPRQLLEAGLLSWEDRHADVEEPVAGGALGCTIWCDWGAASLRTPPEPASARRPLRAAGPSPLLPVPSSSGHVPPARPTRPARAPTA